MQGPYMRIREVEGGLTVVVVNEDGMSSHHTEILSSDIEAICRVTVNGRDLEDGLAPIEIVSEIITGRTGIQTDGVKDVPAAPWLSAADIDGLDQAAFDEAYMIKPMDHMLANLVMFGGEKNEIACPITEIGAERGGI